MIATLDTPRFLSTLLLLLPRPIGGRSFRFSADGQWALFVNGQDLSSEQRLWRDAADFSAGEEITNVIPGGTKLVFTHPSHPCTWVVQTGPTELMKTSDCAATWQAIPLTGFKSSSPMIAGAYAPDQTDTLIVFTKDGQRFGASVP